MPPQIKHLIVVFAALIALFVGVRFLLVPASFGKYGHYRADSIDEIKKQEPKYVGRDECAACHPEIVKKNASSSHAGVVCQACHGPAAKHIEDPIAVKPDKPRGREFCALCHAKNEATPKDMPQVDFESHNVGMECFLCHNPHSPKLK